LDYGEKTIGVAVSDPLGMTAQGLEIIRRQNPIDLKESFARLGGLLEEYRCSTVVLGYPLGMDGKEGINCERMLGFKAKLEKRLNVTVILEDERLTTVSAGRVIAESGLSGKKRGKVHRQVIDKIAAVYILQTYLDRKNKNFEV